MKRKADSPKSLILQNIVNRASSFSFGEISIVVGQRVLELIVNLGAMVLVERTYGQSDLGVYSYLLAFYHLAAYLAEFGIPRYAEREIALHWENQVEQGKILCSAFQGLITLCVVVAVSCMLSASYDTSHTQVHEKMAAYFILALAIPLRNMNRLRVSALNGQGRHDEAARLQMKKRIVFMGVFLILLTMKVVPSYLIASFLLSEIYLARTGRRSLRLPSIRLALAGSGSLRDVLGEGYRLMFTDDALEMFLYIDLFVLGVFMSDWDLGVYAEAAILVRFFLLIPVSIRPVFRRKYCVMAAQGSLQHASLLARKASLRLFFLHSLVALYVMLFYPAALKFLFKTQGEELLSFEIFKVFIPGMLLSATVITLEPLYEAIGRVDALRGRMMIVFAVNLVLNVYLIPTAGLFGAAFATTISMLLHFLLIGRGLKVPHLLDKGTIVVGGGGVYVVYGIMQQVPAGMLWAIFLLPLLVYVVFYFVGFFNDEESQVVQPMEGGGIDGGAKERDPLQV